MCLMVGFRCTFLELILVDGTDGEVLCNDANWAHGGEELIDLVQVRLVFRPQEERQRGRFRSEQTVVDGQSDVEESGNVEVMRRERAECPSQTRRDMHIVNECAK